MKLDLDGTEDSVLAILKAVDGDVTVLRVAAHALVDALKDGIKQWSAEELALLIANMNKIFDIKISN